MSAPRRQGGRAARLQSLGQGGSPRPAGAEVGGAATPAATPPLRRASGTATAPSAATATAPHAGRRPPLAHGLGGAGSTVLQSEKVLVIACGALGREIVRLAQLNGWTHFELVCLPAILHNHPGRIIPAIEAAVEEYRARYARVFVAYADCGTGGLLAAACTRLGVGMLPGPHCYAFYSGTAAFAARDETRSFFLTDFLTRQFDAFVWRELGLDRHPELRNLYFGNYEKLVYLAQTQDPALDAKASEAARRLDLAYERRFTGFGELEQALAEA